jgi:outer membrane protein OmpA-like peptidoglycan-associated protein
MAVQYGKCTNRAGCTLAYTGDQIRFEGAPICPECGQPLAVIKGSGGAGGKLWLLILLPILLIGMVAAGYFIVQSLLGLNGSNGSKSSASATATATVSATATATPTASATTPTTDQSASPSPSPSGSAPPPSGAPSASPGGSVDANPKPLSNSDIEATRKQVLTRLQAMPGKSQQEKDKLADKVQSARSMERLTTIYFQIGSSMIPKPQVDQFIATFNDQKMKEKMSDPTLVFVVAGYADKSGNPGGNQALSNARAENIARLMKQAGVTNVIHTVAMGGTDVLENTRPDQNRAVEIWSVIP